MKSSNIHFQTSLPVSHRHWGLLALGLALGLGLLVMVILLFRSGLSKIHRGEKHLKDCVLEEGQDAWISKVAGECFAISCCEISEPEKAQQRHSPIKTKSTDQKNENSLEVAEEHLKTKGGLDSLSSDLGDNRGMK